MADVIPHQSNFRWYYWNKWQTGKFTFRLSKYLLDVTHTREPSPTKICISWIYFQLSNSASLSVLSSSVVSIWLLCSEHNHRWLDNITDILEYIFGKEHFFILIQFNRSIDLQIFHQSIGQAVLPLSSVKRSCDNMVVLKEMPEKHWRYFCIPTHRLCWLIWRRCWLRGKTMSTG